VGEDNQPRRNPFEAPGERMLREEREQMGLTIERDYL
jgi:hypothetical protein